MTQHTHKVSFSTSMFQYCLTYLSNNYSSTAVARVVPGMVDLAVHILTEYDPDVFVTEVAGDTDPIKVFLGDKPRWA